MKFEDEIQTDLSYSVSLIDGNLNYMSGIMFWKLRLLELESTEVASLLGSQKVLKVFFSLSTLFKKIVLLSCEIWKFGACELQLLLKRLTSIPFVSRNNNELSPGRMSAKAIREP